MTATTKTSKSRRRDVARRRAEILRAARDEFVANGYGGARTKAIAESAGVTETVLYRYFASKEEMFQEAVLVPLEEFFQGLLPLDAAAVDAAEDLASREVLWRQAAHGWLDAMEGIVPLLGAALSTDLDSSRRFYQERVYPLIEAAFKVTDRSIATWGRPGADPAMAIFMLIGTSVAIAMDRHLRGPDEDVEQLAAKFVDQAVYGVSPFPPEVVATREKHTRS